MMTNVGMIINSQRIARGFDDSELWNLGDTILESAIPRLERFIENGPVGRPSNFDTYDEYMDFLKNMLTTLRLCQKLQDWAVLTEDEQKVYDESMKRISELFFIWD